MIADRTANTTFYHGSRPEVIMGVANLEDNDYFLLPYGTAVECIVNASDDDDVIATATVSGGQITVSLIDDAGSGVASDQDIVFKAILKHQ